MLAETLGAIELTEVRRFASQWERDASLRLRQGDKPVLAAYDTRGRIRGLHREAAYSRAAGAWLADHLRGKDVLLLAGSNAEAAELARLVQAQLIKAGSVHVPCTDLADGNRAGVGDLVRARLNVHIDAGGQQLTNRDTLKITASDGADVQVRRLLADGTWSARFTVPGDYLRDNAELAYAGNVHVAQGRTVDLAHLLVTERCRWKPCTSRSPGAVKPITRGWSPGKPRPQAGSLTRRLHPKQFSPRSWSVHRGN